MDGEPRRLIRLRLVSLFRIFYYKERELETGWYKVCIDASLNERGIGATFVVMKELMTSSSYIGDALFPKLTCVGLRQDFYM